MKMAHDDEAYYQAAIQMSRRRDRMQSALKAALHYLTGEAGVPEDDVRRNVALLGNAWSIIAVSKGSTNELHDVPTRSLFVFESAPQDSVEHAHEQEIFAKLARLIAEHPDKGWHMLSNFGGYRLEDIREAFMRVELELSLAFELWHMFFQRGMGRSEDRNLLPTAPAPL